MDFLALRSGLAIHPLSPAISFGPILAGINVRESRRRSSLEIELLVLSPALWQVGWLRYFSRCRRFDRRRAAVVMHISLRITEGVLLINVPRTAILLPTEKSLLQFSKSIVVVGGGGVVWCCLVLMDLGERGGVGRVLAKKHGKDQILQIITVGRSFRFRIVENLARPTWLVATLLIELLFIQESCFKDKTTSKNRNHYVLWIL